MDCLSCKTQNCQLKKQDCNNQQSEVLDLYRDPKNRDVYVKADSIVSNGKAGSLARVEEIVAYAKANNIGKIAIAYCYGLHSYALQFSEYLKENGIAVSSYRCTVNGISENQIHDELGENVNCNPIGQALAVNRDDSELVVELGLCLGHDILFHKYLEKPFTVLAVKDRTLNNDPLSFFSGNYEKNDYDISTRFIEELDAGFGMKSKEWLQQKIQTDAQPLILDLRDADAFNKSHIPGSIQVLLKDLPKRYSTAIPDKSTEIICLCNGSIQSAYAVMFLRMKGYKNCYNLSGGYAGWQRIDQ